MQALAKLSLVASRKTGNPFDGTGWHVFARAKASANGSATPGAKFKRGVYRVRARFVGSLELAGTASRTLTLRVR